MVGNLGVEVWKHVGEKKKLRHQGGTKQKQWEYKPVNQIGIL